MKRAVIMAEGKLVTAADLDLDSMGEDAGDVINLKTVREMADRTAIRRAGDIALRAGNGAAKMLGISRPTLYDLLKQYEMQA
jgi:two-component system NtrC family response regulator